MCVSEKNSNKIEPRAFLPSCSPVRVVMPVEACPICLEEEKGWKGYVTSHCGHTVCYPCFSRLRTATENPSCPLCRASYLQDGWIQPSPTTRRHAQRIAAEYGKPVSMEYFTKDTFLGIDSTSSRKVLVQSVNTYSVDIQKVYKTSSEYIIVTGESVNIVPGTMPMRRIADSSV